MEATSFDALEEVMKELPDLRRSHIPLSYAPKLAENYIPTEAEAEEVKSFAARINQQATQISEEMSILKERIRQLNLKQAQLQEAHAPYKALASATRRLPDPVLQRIFIECLPKNRNAVMHAAEAPVLLGRVCSLWRRISLATPEIWSKLHIVPPHVFRDSRKRSEERFLRKRDLVQMWLARAGECPLTLSFVWFGEVSADAVQLNGVLLDVLIPLSKRWREIDIQAPMALLAPFYKLTREDLPLLEIISFMGSRADVLDPGATTADPEIQDAVNLVGRAPHLRELCLAFNISRLLPVELIPWRQLRVLYLESNVNFFFTDLDQMLSLLAGCTVLQSLSLKYPINQTQSLPPYKRAEAHVVLPQLEVLCIDGDQRLKNTFDMAGTFASLTAPKLLELSILGRTPHADVVDTQELLDSVRDLLRVSQCPLERLKLESICLSREVLLECLRLVPTLTELTVYSYLARAGTDKTGAVLENDLLRALTPHQGSVGPDSEGSQEAVVPVICPHLKTFDYNTLNEADEELFRRFVELRCKNVPEGIQKLQSVKTTLTGRETKEVRDWIAEMKTEGLELSLLYHTPFIEDRNPSPWTGVMGY